MPSWLLDALLMLGAMGFAVAGVVGLMVLFGYVRLTWLLWRKGDR